MIKKCIGARVGIMGNPSDGFGGKTVACLIANFSASVILRENSLVEIVHHPVFDPVSFSSLPSLAEASSFDGYYSGIRLLYATCKKFCEYCQHYGISLPKRNFALEYDTKIPRQVGLGGSSAIITAAIKALVEFYELGEEDIPKAELPNLTLAVETEELGIVAGLQDRVVQAYGGLVYMDFSDRYMEANGHGYYEDMQIDCLPPMYLAYSSECSDSGNIHSPVKSRFDRGDPEVISAVESWGVYTDEARHALRKGDTRLLGTLMDLNFDLRRRIYGDQCIGARNLQMAETARKLGLPAKFAGSGGAVIGIYEDDSQLAKAKNTFQNMGCDFTRLFPKAYEAVTERGEVALAASSGL